MFKFRKRFLFFIVLLSTLFLPLFLSAEVLWDQPVSATNKNAYYNEIFLNEDPQLAYKFFIADDFVNTKTWHISTIFVPGEFRQTPVAELDEATLLHWEIWEDNGGVPMGNPGTPPSGSPYWSLYLAPDDPQVSLTEGGKGFLSNTTLNLNTPITLPPGTWWLIFYPEMPINRFGRQPSDTVNGNPAQLIEKDQAGPVGVQGFPAVWTSVIGFDWGVTLPMLTPPLQDFSFTLEGLASSPDIAVNPTSIDFGAQVVGLTSHARTVTVSNEGDSDLLLSSITITGDSADMFNVVPGTTNGCALTNQTLAPAGTCTLSVTFTPSASDAQTATLEIASDDPDTGIAEISLSGTCVEEAVPSVTEGTVGTVITFTAGPSVNFGTKKGTVIIQKNKVKSVAKIVKGGWSEHTITCTVNKALPAGTYDVKIMLQPYKDNVSIDIPGGFTFKKPEVNLPLEVNHGAKGDLRTLTGYFFGNKKPKVYLIYEDTKGKEKKKSCPVTKLDLWVPTTGESIIRFKVPGGLADGIYPLYVERKGVGISEEEVDFTITR